MNNQLTVKQLLTRCPSVQNKEGYTSFGRIPHGMLSYLAQANASMVLSATAEDGKLMMLKGAEEAFSGKSSLSTKNFFLGSFAFFEYLLLGYHKIFFCDKTFAETLSHTVPPKSFIFKQMFLPSFVVLMPKDFSFPAALFYCQKDPRIDEMVNCVVFFRYSAFSRNTTKTMLLPTEFYSWRNGETMFLVRELKDGSNASIAHKWFLNFLLWQQSMHDKGQEVVQLDTPTRKMGFGKNAKKIIVPQVIGEGYKPKVIRNYETTGTHASPRTHWRSGHWRQHMIGSRENPQHKTIWIEPTLING